MTRRPARDEPLPLPLLRRGKVREVYEVGPRRTPARRQRPVSAFDVVMRRADAVQGRGADPADRVLVPAAGAGARLPTSSPPCTDEIVARLPALGRHRDQLRRPRHAGAPHRARAVRVRGARLPVRLGVEGVPRQRHARRRAAARGAAGERAPRPAALLAGHQGGDGTRHERHRTPRWQPPSAPTSPRRLRALSFAVYTAGRDHAAGRGIIIADTKFEFGHAPDGTLLLIDEVLTPDSSRFWPADRYAPGRPAAELRQAAAARLPRRAEAGGPVERRGARRHRCPTT